MPQITAVPRRGAQSCGVINLRGQVLPLIDLRRVCGWKSVSEELDEFYSLMNQREQDHRNWLLQLEKSAKEGTEFRLATDPHKCAFGQWYYSYRSQSPWITALLRRFETPHNRIHAVASSVIQLVNSQNLAEAYKLIEQKRNGELREMVALFQDLKALMREAVKQLAVVITTPSTSLAMSVDSAIAVETISPDLIKDLHTNELLPGCGLVRKLGHRKAANSLALILEPEMLGVSTPIRDGAVCPD